MLTPNGLLPSIQMVPELSTSSVFRLHCSHSHTKCIRPKIMDASHNCKYVFHDIHLMTQPDVREEGVVVRGREERQPRRRC